MTTPTRLALALLLLGLPPTAPCAAAPLRSTAISAMPPTVSGAAGPFARVTVTVKTTDAPDGYAIAFSSSVALPGGKRLALPGPDEPADLFFLEPRAVLFMPIDRSRTNRIVILYNSSQIGPQHGTDHRALVYRLTKTAAVRQPAIEAKLEGAADAATARARLRPQPS